MSLIQWNSGLSVNVVEIDRQHRKLIQMISDLSTAMHEQKGKEVIGKVIDGLIAYTQTHFSTEEKYFKQFKYPDALSHQKEHADFVKKVLDFKDGFTKGKIGLTIDVMYFLRDWLKNHIQGSDKKYGPFFNEKGLK